MMYSPRWSFLYPGLALMIGGTAMALWLLPGPRSVGTVTIDIHTLLYAIMAILIGCQAVTFSVFTKVFAITEKLMPEGPRLNRLFRHFRLETGLAVGGLLIAAGVGLAVYSLFLWDAHNFGPMDPERLVRVDEPAPARVAVMRPAVLLLPVEHRGQHRREHQHHLQPQNAL